MTTYKVYYLPTPRHLKPRVMEVSTDYEELGAHTYASMVLRKMYGADVRVLRTVRVAV